ncbi:MAG: 2Fe-2S iron-sulfur cluster binding domain-containing protein [Phycisphaerales bacterium]|nr:2Fe-2S iron-sulfur cluster binding domain-containing protein [Phycisphaerales bacterium]
MGGQNPYIKEAQTELPAQRYTLTVIDEQKREHRVEVDPARIPYGDHGLPGSILDICMAHGIELDHACGGVCACSTCHVVVRRGLEACNECTDDEADQLDEAYGLTAQSRLGCQCVPNGRQDVVVEIPTWNRNLAREGH